MLKAGTGKSTLVKFIIAAMNIPEDSVRYVAYTGKAANVLKNKGCSGAMTAHKLLYYSKMLPNGNYVFKPRPAGVLYQEGIRVIVVDEISMLPKDMWDLMCSYNFYILACGDPEQLPPVPDPKAKTDPNNHVLDKPHIFLDEIMRQAQESEIIRLSMHVREGKPLSTFPVVNQQVMIFDKKDLEISKLIWADQILCATNRTRHMINSQIRDYYGFDPNSPQIGDKVINLHNEWNLVSNHENPLTNGIIGTIKDFQENTLHYPYWIRKQELSVPVITATISGDEENEEFSSITFDKQEILTGSQTLKGTEEYLIKNKVKEPLPLHFNFGYAITVWKAQGSEWNKVLLFEEQGWPRDEETRRRFLYTGITRAVDRLVIIKK